MCVEIPSKVILVKGKKAKIKQGDNSCWVDISSMEEEVKEGDYLILYQKVAINKVPQEEIDKVLELVGDLSDHHHH